LLLLVHYWFESDCLDGVMEWIDGFAM